MNYEFLCNMDYETLKYHLRTLNEPELKMSLSNKELKEKLINPENKYDFIWFVQSESSKIVELLLDATGIEILNNSEYLIDKYNAILTSGNNAVNEIIKNNSFCDKVDENFNELRYCMSSITGAAIQNIYNYYKSKGQENKFFSELYKTFNRYGQKEFVQNNDISINYLKKTLLNSKKESLEFILQNDIRIENIQELSYEELICLADAQANIDPLLKNKKIVDSIVQCGNTYFYRTIIKLFEQTTDMSDIERKREQFTEQILSTYDEETGMLEIYNQIYLELLELNTERIYIDELQELLEDKVKFTSESYSWSLAKKIVEVLSNKGNIKEFLIEESNIEMTNMIIDSSFKDYYPNVILDIKEVLSYNSGAVSVINEESFEMYEQLIRIDELDYEEKMNVYNKLKSTNLLEKFYDDVRKSKDSSYSKIKDSIITKEKSSDLFSKEKSEKYKTEIFELNGEDFFALIKSFATPITEVLNANIDKSYVDGSSYSLIGSDNLDTFYSPSDHYNIVYTDFNPDNIVHIFPTDSFSKYKHTSSDNGTNRINNISTPTELLQKSTAYNEIIISQTNDSYKSNELNDSLSRPIPGFILCYDEITDNLVESSKVTGLPILLINTEKYKCKKSEEAVKLHQTMSTDSHNPFSYYNENQTMELIEETELRHK